MTIFFAATNSGQQTKDYLHIRN